MSIYIKERNCIYIHIPKTGGGSIETLIGGVGHKNIAHYRNKVNEYENVFRFSFVREPFTRFISSFNHSNLDPEVIFEMVMNDDFSKLSIPLYLPQNHFLHWRGENQMTFIGYYENLEADYDYVADLLMLPKGLPHANKGIFNAADFLHMRPAIMEYYKEDYEEFYPDLVL